MNGGDLVAEGWDDAARWTPALVAEPITESEYHDRFTRLTADRGADRITNVEYCEALTALYAIPIAESTDRSAGQPAAPATSYDTHTYDDSDGM